ncbi:YceI family protein [Salinibacterium sp. SYSU T00001]|uniref:YceI family protein n=1 Tax=Homoserinimonas sedimenticola TaxID=2986805 RepID=UPI0022365DC0|nr:YceI family protein [Salinibacterium sedimenticola]MCW4384235.1 YceI family protein [Salinibacterium sedimenticola]
MATRSRLLIIGGIIVVLGIVAALAGPIVYRDLIAGPAADEPTAELQEAGALEPSTLEEGELAGTWTVTSGSYAGYRVDEVLNGTDVTVTGRTEQVSGTVETSEMTVTAATITVDVASITTDSSNRDEYFRNRALLVEQYPTATFELAGPIAAPEGASVDEPQTVAATGILTMAGVSRDVTVELVAAVSGSTVQVAGQIPVTFADYGVEAPNLGFVQVEPSGFVEFLVVFEKLEGD